MVFLIANPGCGGRLVEVEVTLPPEVAEVTQGKLGGVGHFVMLQILKLVHVVVQVAQAPSS